MKHDLIITKIGNDHAKTIIARLLSQKQQIPLQQALQIVNRPPFVFLIDLSIEEANYYISQMQSIGVLYKLIKSQKPQVETHSSVPSQNSKVDLQKPAPEICTTQDNHTSDKILNRSIELKSKPKKKVNHHLSPFEYNVKPLTKSKIATYIIVIILFSLPAILIIISINQKSSFFLSKYSGQIDSTSFSNGQDKIEKKKSSKKNQKNASVNSAKSDSYVDSAEVYDGDFEKMINFYKLAISINKYNYKAWYGLVNTYTNAQLFDEAKEAKEQMKIIFGKQIFTISSIVEPYGTIIKTTMNEDNSYYLEYRSKASNKKALMNETFQIIRAIKPECNCSSISVFASQTAGTGLIVHLKKEAVFNSVEEFNTAASFTYLE